MYTHVMHAQNRTGTVGKHVNLSKEHTLRVGRGVNTQVI